MGLRRRNRLFQGEKPKGPELTSRREGWEWFFGKKSLNNNRRGGRRKAYALGLQNTNKGMVRPSGKEKGSTRTRSHRYIKKTRGLEGNVENKKGQSKRKKIKGEILPVTTCPKKPKTLHNLFYSPPRKKGKIKERGSKATSFPAAPAKP